MKDRSIDSVISAMIARLAQTRPEECGAGDPLKDAALFAAADPVMAALYKEYTEARNRHAMLCRARGGEDPMAEVAADMLDSARSAMVTRLIEWRDSAMEEQQESLALRLRACRAQEEAAAALALADMRRRDKSGDIFFWLMMLAWMMRRTAVAAGRRISVAADFAAVSALGRRVRHA